MGFPLVIQTGELNRKDNNIMWTICWTKQKSHLISETSSPLCQPTHPTNLPVSFRVSVNVFTGRWSRWWILKQITLIIVFHNCQLCEGCQCAQELFVCQYVLHTPPLLLPALSTLPPTSPTHPSTITRDALTVSSPELVNQEDTFTDDTFITINQGNLIKKVIPPLY